MARVTGVISTARQLGAIARAAVIEMTWTLPSVADEVRHWRILADEIPSRELRRDALSSLDHKRGHTDGAALFTILASRHRNRQLLRLLVTYEILWDYLDSVNERGAHVGIANGRRLHLALVDALDASGRIRDYYREHPWSDDGGYLRQLVATCQSQLPFLPSYPLLAPYLRVETWRAQVLALNHEPCPSVRDRELQRWARNELPPVQGAYWFELTGAVSASLTVHALLTLASNRDVTPGVVMRTRHAYYPWISAATTMLDSFVDQVEDVKNGDHSYISHYPSAVDVPQRVSLLLSRALHEARDLPQPHRHTLIVAAMAAMYLTKDAAKQSALRDASRDLIAVGGWLTRGLHPLLTAWRSANAQRSA